MKIVIAVHHFPPNYAGGAETYTFRLARWLARQGHDVNVVCIESVVWDSFGTLQDTDDIYEGISISRLHLHIANGRDWFRHSYDNPAIGTWFLRYLQRTEPDLVHIHSCYLLSVATIGAVRQQSVPTLLTLHDFWFLCPRITLLTPTGQVCTVPKNPAECSWCLATQQRRFRFPAQIAGKPLSVLAYRLLSVPLVPRLLGVYPDPAEIIRRRQVLKNALDQIDVIISPSRFLRDLFIRQGLSESRIIYSRIGLDTSNWTTPDKSARSGSEYLRIGYIGQVAPHKGVHLLIRAFNRLDTHRRGATLKIYGDTTKFPRYTRSLLALAGDNNAIEFAGPFDNRGVQAILHDLDITVTPSIWYENSPVAIMESLTAGTPVVTANLGGMPELVQHNLQGLLFKPGDASDLATQLQRLLDAPDLVTKLASRALPPRTMDNEMSYLTMLYDGIRAKVR